MSKLFPIFLNLKGKKVLLVGAGKVGLEKLNSLKNTGAEITIIAKDILDDVLKVALEYPNILIEERDVFLRDLDDQFMIILATNDREFNAKLTDYAKSKNILVNSVDDPENCNFFSAAVIDRGPIRIAVSTDGKFAGLSAVVKRVLEDLIPKEHSEELEKLVDFRNKLKSRIPESSKRIEIIRGLLKKLEDEYFGLAGDYMSELEKVELVKEASKGLRGTIAETLSSNTDGFEEDDKQLLKFHGIYQQKIRGNDIPEELKVHTFMIRGRIPGGRLTAEQYLKWDELGDKYGGNTIRLTTRQSVQLHGIIKANLKDTIRKVNEMHLSTMGACGDVVRNVTQAVNPKGDAILSQLDAVANLLSDHFKYTSHGYAEIWLDEEKVTEEKLDPIYGKTYLPRKFKIAVTLTGDNSVDIYTNDMGFAATTENGKINGYFVFAGGGLGMTHNKPNTFPRKADLLGWVPADKLIPIAEAIVTSHRDFGDRTNRKHARLKYVLEEKGVEWFRKEVESRSGISIDTAKVLPTWNTPNYLGWHERTDGTLSLGFHTLSGRIKDFSNAPLKSALKEIVSTYQLNVQLTADQDLILIGIQKTDKEKITQRLKELNVNPESPNKLFNRALACPALPTCGLALTESERNLPNVLEKIQALLVKYNLMDRAPLLRMTGCPNGCARPYTAEIGLVGQQTGGKYAVYIGGDAEGSRIAKRYSDKATLDDIYTIFDTLFKRWKEEGEPKELFGDFTLRKIL